MPDTGQLKYTGSTWIAEGTMELVGISSLRNSSGVRVDGVLDVSQTADGVNDINGTPGGTAIKLLTGTGQVATGARNLQVNEDGTDFSGKISGTGKLVLQQGTSKLSGASDFSGGTELNGSRVEVGHSEARGAGSGL